MPTKLKLSGVLISFSLGACASMQETSLMPLETEIKTVFEALVDATVSKDLRGYYSFFDANAFSAISSDGSIIPTFEAFRVTYEPHLAAVQRYESLEFQAVEIRIINAETAILTNEFRAELVLVSGEHVSASGAGVQVWVKRGDRWKLAHVTDIAKQS